MSKMIDMIGKKFGRLTVFNRASYRYQSQDGRATWWCLCECGNRVVVQGKYLRSGHTQSCGCLNKERFKPITKHGKAKTPEWQTWVNMRARCRNPKDPGWKYYGERGVMVCIRWQQSFQNFLNDMGPKPTPKHSIERIDNNGPYCPENCKWATAKEQANNRRPRTHREKP